MTITTRFNTTTDIKTALLAAINAAAVSIYVLTYDLQDLDIVNALIAAKLAGRVVEVVADYRKTLHRNHFTHQLIDGGVPLFRTYQKTYMHSTAVIIDALTVITGCYRYIHGAENHAFADSIQIDDAGTAADYKTYYDVIKAGAV